MERLGVPTGLTLECGHGVQMKLVLIPPGEFVMGSAATEDGRQDESQHRVRITRAFYMSATEVTQTQYEAAMGENPSQVVGAARPVERATWDDARGLCKMLSEQWGRVARLPTEAEWEYACRAGTATAFNTGDEIKPSEANCRTPETDLGGDYRNKTTPAGHFPPNAWGLHDMHGNVWEWCSDWYVSNPGPPADDPQGPITGGTRVARGGGVANYAWGCRSAARGHLPEGSRDSSLGLRVVVEVE